MTISLCMIVRDAEHSLGLALESARPFMDELVVVDTGSVDRTQELAGEHGAAVFRFEWCDDFSAARNYSIEQATGDWIFWMDADDVLPPQSGQELRRLAEQHPDRDAAFWVTVEEDATRPGGRQRIMGHAHVKLFPRHPDIRFEYRVHEQVSPSIKRLGLQLKRTAAVVRHTQADRTPEGEEARNRRNLRLLLLDLADAPQDPFVLMNLGTTYLFREGGHQLAVAFLRQSIDRFRSGVTTQLNAYLALGQAYGSHGNREAERRTYAEALELFPDDAALLLRLGAACEHSGRLDEASRCYQRALAKGKLRPAVVHLRNGPAHAVIRLGQVFVRQGRPERAAQLWEEFLATSPEQAEIRRALAALRS